jgi:hypothetical protein
VKLLRQEGRPYVARQNTALPFARPVASALPKMAPTFCHGAADFTQSHLILPHRGSKSIKSATCHINATQTSSDMAVVDLVAPPVSDYAATTCPTNPHRAGSTGELVIDSEQAGRPTIRTSGDLR